MKKILIFIFLLLCPFIVEASENEYIINKYDIEIVVNENNTFDITEHITADFKVPKHGIYRTLPLQNNVERLDGTVSKNRVAITNIELSDNYSRENVNGNLKLQIGDEERTITGTKSYTIKYNYNIGKDPLKDKDEFYYNIIGTEWDTSISGISFKIVMPKDFDVEKLGFSYGKEGSGNNGELVYDTDGRVITGTLNTTLSSYEGLTMRLELPEGYFKGAGNKFSVIDIAIIVVSALGALYMYILWSKYGRDDIVVDSVEFYPPEDLDPLEISYIYSPQVGNNGVIALLISLANKGYLKIEEDPEKKKDFMIIKLKEYDGNNESEKLFFNGLFTEGAKDENEINELKGTVGTLESRVTYRIEHSKKLSVVTKKDLENSFFEVVDLLKTKTMGRDNRKKYFDKKSDQVKGWSFLLILFVFLITALPPIIVYEFYEIGITGLVFIFIVAFLFFISFTKFKKYFLLTILSGFVYAIITIFLMLPVISFDTVYLVLYIVGQIAMFIMCLSWTNLDKRTEYGTKIYGRVKGFRNFLETAEKERLESLVEKNPTYFYDILPYTYALNISSKWIKKFESIAIEPPTWYAGYDTFDMYRFESFMNNTVSSASESMTSRPASSSGTGGGFSGGGSGGGGGGSW